MPYVCRADSPTGHSHCASQGLDQCGYCARYQAGNGEPHFPVPAIPLQVVWPDASNMIGYKDMIYIDSLQHGEDDPVMVCAWDFHEGPNRIGKYGEYTPTNVEASHD